MSQPGITLHSVRVFLNPQDGMFLGVSPIHSEYQLIFSGRELCVPRSDDRCSWDFNQILV
jgi:hypothetical protein